MLKRSGIRIDAKKTDAFKKAARENAHKHGKTYWNENKRYIERKLDVNRIKALYGDDK